MKRSCSLFSHTSCLSHSFESFPYIFCRWKLSTLKYSKNTVFRTPPFAAIRIYGIHCIYPQYFLALKRCWIRKIVSSSEKIMKSEQRDQMVGYNEQSYTNNTSVRSPLKFRSRSMQLSKIWRLKSNKKASMVSFTRMNQLNRWIYIDSILYNIPC